METGNKIENSMKELKKFNSSFHHKAPKEPLLQTILIFLVFFLIMNYYYVRPKTLVTKNFLISMSRGNSDAIQNLATECSLYKNKNLNQAIKNEYLNQLSYIIKINKSSEFNKFHINLTNDNNFSFDIKVNGSGYGSLTRNINFINSNGNYKLDTNAYVKKVCSGSTRLKTEAENRLLMKQLLYCYQYYLDDYINTGDTNVFRFITKNGELFKYIVDLKKNSLHFSQNTKTIEFKDIRIENNSATIKVYETIRQNDNKIINLKKQNLTYEAINSNNHWLLNSYSLQN